MVERTRQTIATQAFRVEKGEYRHFMAKEIHEQPEVVGRTLAHYVDMAEGRVVLPEALPFDFAKLSRVYITACGTAFYAGLVARYWFEQIARLPVEIDVASEARYREAPLERDGLTLVISQSGETADTLASLRYAKSKGQHTLSVVNVPTSTIARESSVVMPTLAGPEIGVASTKAFSCQLTVLLCLAIAAGRARGTLDAAAERRLIDGLIKAPGLMAEALAQEPDIEGLAREVSKARDVLYLGRGTSYPMALEGALKLKEISYIHAEGYAAGELKHGPIALIDESVPVIVIAPHDAVFEKTVSNMQRSRRAAGASCSSATRRARPSTGSTRWRPSPCRPSIRSSRRSCTPCRSSCSPTTWRCSWGKTSISREIWRSPSRWSEGVGSSAGGDGTRCSDRKGRRFPSPRLRGEAHGHLVVSVGS